MAEGIIYGLCEPDTGELRYVGKTVRTPEGRARSHVRKAYSGHEDFKSAWIRGLFDRGLEPKVVILDVVDANEVLAQELAWIRAAWELELPLTNLAGIRRG